jgi:TRAP-type C4-dicarboxylate transport system permease small subunit
MKTEHTAPPIEEELAAASGFIPNSNNTPPFLKGRLLCIWNATLTVQRFIMMICGITLTGLVFTQVITRYFFNTSLFGIEELATFTAVFLYFFGMSHAAWERGHISASLVELILPAGRPQLAVEFIVSIITAVLSGWMTLWAWNYFKFVIKRGTISLETDIPMSWIIAVIPFCMALMTMYFAIEAILRMQALIAGKVSK